MPKSRCEIRLDEINLDSTYYTDEGYLIDSPIVTTCGIFEYKQPDGTVRRELRRPQDVFDAESLASFKGKPILFTHGAGLVDKSNASRESIGTITSSGRKDGDTNVVCDIVIHDTDVLERYGYRALSLGYNQTFVEEPGVWNGEPYDGYQTDIRINHLALVRKARAGESARLNIDSADDEENTGGKTMSNPKTDPKDKKCMDDGLVPTDEGTPADNGDDVLKGIRERQARRDTDGVPTDPEAAAALIAEQAQDIATLLSTYDTAMAKNDFAAAPPAEPAAAADGAGAPPPADPKDDDPEVEPEENKDAEGVPAALAAPPPANTEPATSGTNVKLEVTMDDIDSIVAQRLAVIRVGDKLNLDGLDTMPLKEAKAAVIKAVRPGMRLDGVSDDYINAAYDMAAAEATAEKSTDRQRRQMMNKHTANFDSGDELSGCAAERRAAMIRRNQRKEG